MGRRVLGGQSTHLPLRVNTSGVIPVIFASSILTFPQTLGIVSKNTYLTAFIDAIKIGEPLYNLLYLGGIIFFCYFYTSIIFNPNEIADNMRKYGGFIPGIRPGKRTAEYVSTILTRITLVGALYLALVAIIPEFMITGFHVQHLPFIGPDSKRIAAVDSAGFECEFLLWRHVAADRRWRRDGHGSDGGISVDHASL